MRQAAPAGEALPRATGIAAPLFVIVVCSFFLSGFSALLYQVAWQRMLGLFAGSDVRSVTIIVGAYLAGLGVGSLMGSLVADRLASRQAVRLFGLCDLGIALFAFASRWIFYDLLFLRLGALAASPTVLLLVAFASVLIPTTLMGLSLPLLAKALVRRAEVAPQRITLLYTINTIGAAVGAVTAGWYLVGTLGFERAVYLGAVLNLIVGLMALALAGTFPRGDQGDAQAQTAPLWQDVPLAVWGWCLLAAASGFVAISLELVWFRLLSVLLESKAYTFAHLLAFVLTGYAVGGWLGTFLLRWVRRPRQVFLAVQGLVALYALASVYVLYERFPTILYTLRDAQKHLAEPADLATNWDALVFGYLTLPALLLLPPNILIGLNFPVTQRAVQTDLQHLGQRVGLIQVAGIAGNTAGSILTGTLLFTLVGTAGALRVITLVGLLMLALLLWELVRHRRLVSAAVAAVGLVAVGAGIVRFPDTAALWTRLNGGQPQDTVVAEDATGVTVLREHAEGGILLANGSAQGAIPFLDVHTLLGAVPALIHPNPERVLIIGIGSAGTAFTAGLRPETREIRTVEIIGSQLPVLEAAATRPWGQALQEFFSDPRYTIIVGDGRRELALNDVRFDIIEADAIQPFRSYSGMLYSKEYFEQARRSLNEGGLMAQWVPTPRTLTTFQAAFPYGVNISNFLLLGSNSPVTIDMEQVQARLADPQVVAYLRAGQLNPDVIRAFLNQATITSWDPATPRSEDINTDLWPRDEYDLNN